VPVSVLQHHLHPSRDGFYTDPAMTNAVARTLKLDATFAPVVAGTLMAQPLYVRDGPMGKEAFIVATEQNHVMAIDAAGKTIWEHPSSPSDPTSYGAPFTGILAATRCGNIDPLGITGTPVIDPQSRTIYFDAMTVAGGTAEHKIYAVSLDDGTIKVGWPVRVNMAVPGFNSLYQNERGALALVGGVVYVPYGGHHGDCAPYHGVVVGVNTTNPASVTAFSTGTIGAPNADQGGIWSVGGVVSDGTSLFVSTGNTANAGGVWSGGEAVLRLSSGPKFTDQIADKFYPGMWASYDGTDTDLGGTNPVLFDLPNGAAVQHLAAALGKDGVLYLLNRDNLGGQDGQLSTTRLAPDGRATGSLKAAPAVYTTSKGTYIAYRIHLGPGMGCPSGGQSGSIGVAQIVPGATPTANVVWCSMDRGFGSPIATTTGHGDAIVWDANDHLLGYDGDSGATLLMSASAMPVVMHLFQTPIDAGNARILVAAGAGLYLFKP
jgi:hypothetical protein